jgi:hypothetical protein
MTGQTAERSRHSRRVYKRVIDLIEHMVVDEGFDEETAIRDFYESQTYRLLADESSKVWWYSTPVLLEIYHRERDTGDISQSSYVDGLI